MLLVDDILALLPEAGLTLWRMDQGRDGWHVVFEQTDEGTGLLKHPSGDGATPIETMAQAFQRAGFALEDDGSPSAPPGFALAYDMPGEKHSGACPTCGTRYLEPDDQLERDDL